ncbi:MAG TPA: response regulator [Terriglobales bacterium]|nr:response regulator [Terriglobales bacterium]
MTQSDALVFVIDDDRSLRQGVVRWLESVGYESEAFESAADFLARLPHDGPCCAIVDVQMPDMDGVALQETLIKRRREEQLIFLTGHGNVPMCARVMKAGAVDFLQKPFTSDELSTVVERALARSAEQRRRQAGKNEAKQLLDLLTPREFEVMQLLLTGMLNKQVAAELGTAERTIKAHRGRVMRKLGITSLPDLVRLAQRAGVSPRNIVLN